MGIVFGGVDPARAYCWGMAAVGELPTSAQRHEPPPRISANHRCTLICEEPTNRAKGILDTDRQSRLEALTGWAWDAQADRWEQGFSRLVQYVKRVGNALVPVSYTIDGYKLGEWVNTQRDFRVKGRLDADRQRRLEGVPGWSWDPRADQWEEGFSHLARYAKRTGDARVPASYTLDGYKLGVWVSTQCTNRLKGILDANRQRRLEELRGWTWDRQAAKWEEGFSQLQRYVERHGDARVPGPYTIDGYRLGQWVAVQRRFLAEGRLDADRQRRLEGLPGWTWNARSLG